MVSYLERLIDAGGVGLDETLLTVPPARPSSTPRGAIVSLTNTTVGARSSTRFTART